MRHKVTPRLHEFMVDRFYMVAYYLSVPIRRYLDYNSELCVGMYDVNVNVHTLLR